MREVRRDRNHERLKSGRMMRKIRNEEKRKELKEKEKNVERRMG